MRVPDSDRSTLKFLRFYLRKLTQIAVILDITFISCINSNSLWIAWLRKLKHSGRIVFSSMAHMASWQIHGWIFARCPKSVSTSTWRLRTSGCRHRKGAACFLAPTETE